MTTGPDMECYESVEGILDIFVISHISAGTVDVTYQGLLKLLRFELL